MENDSIVGSVIVAEGQIKGAIDDDRLRVEGAADVANGRIQNAYGQTKEKLKSIYVLPVPRGQRN